MTGRSFTLFKIRANRPRPGLRPQHLTAVRAVAEICDARLEGATINSTALEFRPQSRPRGGDYAFDVAKATSGGSAGAVTLIIQAILWPLLFAPDPSNVTLCGGTHVPYSPSFHYLDRVARPAIHAFGAQFEVKLAAWGWYPHGGGKMEAAVTPVDLLKPVDFAKVPAETVKGIAAVTNLPAHIPQRMAGRARNLLRDAGFLPSIQTLRARASGPGASLLLWAPQRGFAGLGRKGLPAEEIAENVADVLTTFERSGAAVDPFLADQLLLPMALARGRSSLTVHRLTQHVLTNVELLRDWLEASIEVDGSLGEAAEIAIGGIGYTADPSIQP